MPVARPADTPHSIPSSSQADKRPRSRATILAPLHTLLGLEEADQRPMSVYLVLGSLLARVLGPS